MVVILMRVARHDVSGLIQFFLLRGGRGSRRRLVMMLMLRRSDHGEGKENGDTHQSCCWLLHERP